MDTMINPFGDLSPEEIERYKQALQKPKKKKSRKSKKNTKEPKTLEESIKIFLEHTKDHDPEKIRIREKLDSVRDRISEELDLDRLRIYVFYHKDQYMIRLYMKLDGRNEKSHVFAADGFMESGEPVKYIILECRSDLFDYEPRMRKTISNYRNSEMDAWEFVKTRIEKSCLMDLLEENEDLGMSTGGACVDIFTTIRRNLHSILKHK